MADGNNRDDLSEQNKVLKTRLQARPVSGQELGGAVRARPQDRFVGFENLGTDGPKTRKSRWLLVLLWILGLAGMLYLAAIPVSVQAQMILAWTLVILFTIMARVWRSQFGRIFAICMSAFVTIRYIVWRTLYTIPDSSNLTDFIPGIMLYGCELYAFIMYTISLFVIIDPIRRKPRPLPQDPSRLPTVDVYVPSFNEEADILRPTLIAAKSMDYPAGKLRVFLLDDGGTEEKRNDSDAVIAAAALERHETLKRLCLELGVSYLTRARNVQAKAGNINAAFKRTKGDLIAVFDADHVPSRDFLQRTVGYFLDDPKLFLVQTPHFFINPDPLEHNLGTFKRMPGENEMFYAQVQRGLDKWNSAFFCGSAALLQRQALTEIDGFEGTSVTEDCETALELHSKGYRSAYVDEPLIAGLQPHSFTDFIGQRTRWAVGMTQIFLLKRPFMKLGLSFAQRISYLSSNLFWLFSFARLGFMISPLFFLFFGLEIYNANVWEFFAFTIPHLFAATLMGHLLYGGVRWPFVSELYEYIQSMFLYKAVLATFWRPKKPTFNVTAKGDTKDEEHLSPLFFPFLIMCFLLFAGLIAALLRLYFTPEQAGIILVVGFWNLFNMAIAFGGLAVMYEKRQVRRTHRMPRRQPVQIETDGQSFEGVMADLSLGGTKIILNAQDVHAHNLQGNLVRIYATDPVRGREMVVHGRIRHLRGVSSGYECGIEFVPQSEAEHEQIISLFYADSEEWSRWQAGRRRRPSAPAGVFFFFKLAFGQGFKAIAFTFREMFGRGRRKRDGRSWMKSAAAE